MPARTIYLIKRLEIEVTARMTKILGAYEITPTQYIVLNFVEDHPDDLSSAQLSRRFSMTPQSMNENIKILQNKELLEKYTDPNHRRILRISLTEKGKETLKLCNSAMDGFEKEFLRPFSIMEKVEFRDLIGKLIEGFRNM
ncbi:MarR family winged helix-turn-helix transcriptional regulator [Haliscomenobacter hydrossis]|uniref:Regulatory protein MarR n=1 Tax=Haliscomenobacter hydrossis (strain ATCC 27775 / DSM 1100 / LMG 10767 / O) TaxID=760192 RepID=F4KYA7_HALH1|nr:MarR family transcriptional regulator [Haliscomenobacter hydrossis]AEE48370.1 regulatory protein MarR [Haliscomenobacter hydrossis DSM 1100]